MTELKFESVVAPGKDLASSVLSEFNPETVVFVFNNNISPIACDLDYLYAKTEQQQSYPVECDSENLGVKVFPTNGLENVSHREHKFLDTINELIFKYGLKHEYYKNSHGIWIDMNTIRPKFAVKNPSQNIFNSMIIGGISDDSKETSIYKKLCNNVMFGDNTNWSRMFVVKNIDDIPKVNYYIVCKKNNNTGILYRVGRGDGTYKLPEAEVYVFEDSNNSKKDNIHEHDVNYGKFTYQLADHKTKYIGSGDYDNNDHHKYEDLLLTFTRADGVTPFTDLDDMFVICNGLFVDYERDQTHNDRIYLNNVVKYAIRQITSIKKSFNIDASEKILENNIIEYDIPDEEKGYSYLFDIKIFKWKDISVSHFKEPLYYSSLLKIEPTESDKSYLLKDKLIFQENVDKNKCILLCNNEIVPKTDWEVDKTRNNEINLLTVSAEFDIIYSEVYKNMCTYLEQITNRNRELVPKLEDYLNVDYSGDAKRNDDCYTKVDKSKEEFDVNKIYYTKLTDNTYERLPTYVTDFDPNKDYYVFTFDGIYDSVKIGLEKYNEDLNEFIKNGGEFNIHFPESALYVTAQQFENRQYAIVSFESLDNKNYSVEVIENDNDLHFNKPYRNELRNHNWGPNDILVLNGVNHKLINKYEDVFTIPQTWYLNNISGVFDNIYGYKLQVVKHKYEDSKYLKLNKQMLITGPIASLNYYEYDAESDKYINLGKLTKFDLKYRILSDEELAKGMKENTTYYTKSGSDYILVPKTITSFEPDERYFVCLFDKDYYVLK